MSLLEMNGRETGMVERDVGVPPGRITYQSKAYELGKRFGPCPGGIRKVVGAFGAPLSTLRHNRVCSVPNGPRHNRAQTGIAT